MHHKIELFSTGLVCNEQHVENVREKLERSKEDHKDCLNLSPREAEQAHPYVAIVKDTDKELYV